MVETTLYRTISTYQTRILCLHGDGGSPESPFTSDLYPADMIDSYFGGIGVRSQIDGEDHVVSYEALSYTWGDPTYTQSIVCNSTSVPITQNLYSALRHLRPPGTGHRYIWIDALCINQADYEERARQVRNMLVIYRRAKRVIAWLGDAHESTRHVLAAAATTDAQIDTGYNVLEVVRGLEDLYSRPWFRRMWVQQEIYAARNLTIQCGNHQFPWFAGLSDPPSLMPQNVFQTHELESVAWHRIFSQGKKAAKPPQPSLHDALVELKRQNVAHLRCFEQFSQTKTPQLDFVETLMITGLLEATDPRDYIYGILGLTNLPARPIAIEKWAEDRSSDLCIPIDYCADVTDILITVTWLAVMKAGLSIIAKFKSWGPGHRDTNVPSWVIDWKVSARAFNRNSPPTEPGQPYIDRAATVDNAWDPYKAFSQSPSSQMRLPAQIPSHQAVFMADNRTTKQSFRKLVVRGIMATNYFASDNFVWQRSKKLKARKYWQIPHGTEAGDIVVYLLNFVVFGFRSDSFKLDSNLAPLVYNSPVDKRLQGSHREYSGGLWLLRPVRSEEYSLVACLSRGSEESISLYDHWDWQPPTLQEDHSYQRLTIHSKIDQTFDKPGEFALGEQRSYRFVIV